MDKKLARKNKILALILGLIVILSVSMAVIWFMIYAPQVLFR